MNGRSGRARGGCSVRAQNRGAGKGKDAQGRGTRVTANGGSGSRR